MSEVMLSEIENSEQDEQAAATGEELRDEGVNGDRFNSAAPSGSILVTCTESKRVIRVSIVPMYPYMLQECFHLEQLS
jgi:hypothetical protein